MEKILVDTNILIRLIVNDNLVLTQKAIRKIEHKIAIVTSVVFAETVFALSSYYKYNRKKLLSLKDFFEIPQFELEDENIAFEALKLFSETKLHFVDCWLLAKSRREMISVTTLDKDFGKAAVLGSYMGKPTLPI